MCPGWPITPVQKRSVAIPFLFLIILQIVAGNRYDTQYIFLSWILQRLQRQPRRPFLAHCNSSGGAINCTISWSQKDSSPTSSPSFILFYLFFSCFLFTFGRRNKDKFVSLASLYLSCCYKRYAGPFIFVFGIWRDDRDEICRLSVAAKKRKESQFTLFLF